MLTFVLLFLRVVKCKWMKQMLMIVIRLFDWAVVISISVISSCTKLIIYCNYHTHIRYVFFIMMI